MSKVVLVHPVHRTENAALLTVIIGLLTAHYFV